MDKNNEDAPTKINSYEDVYEVDGRGYLIFFLSGFNPSKASPKSAGPVDHERRMYFVSRSVTQKYRQLFVQFEIRKQERFRDFDEPWREALLLEIEYVSKGNVERLDEYDYYLYRREYFHDIALLVNDIENPNNKEALHCITLLDKKFKEVKVEYNNPNTP